MTSSFLHLFNEYEANTDVSLCLSQPHSLLSFIIIIVIYYFCIGFK